MRSATGILAFVALVCLWSSVETTPTDGFTYVIQALSRYESRIGAFRMSEQDERVSLEATSHALFLTNLLGLNNKIDTALVASFVASVRNPDHGYAQAPGYSSDLESTRQAVLTYQRLGQPIPDSSNIASYIHSLLNKETNLFGNRAGEKGDVKSTAYAFQILHLLGLQPQFLKTVSSSVQQYLKAHSKDSSFSFPEFSPVSGNYYGILLASYSDYQFTDVEKWVNFIASFQSKEGGFYADANKSTVSLETSSHAVSSIHILQSQSKSSANLFEKLNIQRLVSFAQHIPRHLKAASLAHLVNAIVNPASEFQTYVQYETVEPNGIMGDLIVQGAHVKPTVRTRNPALSIDVAIATGSSVKNLKLQWKGNQYVTDDFLDTSNLLGVTTFTYTIRSGAIETGVVTSVVKDVKSIGYGIDITSEGTFGGSSIEEGDVVGVGAELSFVVALHTSTQAAITSGDFDVVFTVLDSSLAPIYSTSINAKGNSAPFAFEHTLKSWNIPTGELICRFEVKNANGVHTRKDIVYKFNVPMIATDISFGGVAFNPAQQPSFKIGDKIEVSMVPASFPDLHTIEVLSGEDYQGKDITAQRQFFLEVKSVGGVSLQRIKGTPTKSSGKTKYVFSFPVSASLESIGSKVISFVYVSASNTQFVLDNFDNTNQELFDETTSLGYSVNAELHVVDEQQKPSPQDFYYGNLITLRFKVKDSVSGKYINSADSESEHSNIFLSLKHQQAGKSRSFVSTHQAAVPAPEGEGYLIKWLINPNAVRGAGILTISGQDADGNTIPVLKEASKEEYAFNVEIGGDIEFDTTTKTTSSNDARETAVVAQFTLKCKDQPLRDAQLRASVYFSEGAGSPEEELFQTGVATNDAGYEVSFTLPHENVKTGSYKIKVFREADKLRVGEDVKPLFELSEHLQATEKPLPVRAEFLILVVLIAAFATINMKSKSIY